MESSITIARVRGIEIGASWTWLLVVAIVVWSLASVLFPLTYPDLDGGTYLIMAVVAALLFFGSILLHELGHALRAQREGVPIEGITLWLFGGVARMRGHPPSPGASFRVSVLGPVVTAVLVVLFAAAAALGDRLDAPDAVQGVVDYLARINLIVLAFNLVPALPLDGGRILQAWIWHRTGSFSASTVQAARAGQLFGYLLVAVGLLGLFTGANVGGIWIAFIGWFLVQAAGAEATHAELRRSLGRLRVREAMTPDPVTVAPDLPVDRFLDEAWRGRHSTYPVMADDEVVGLVSARDGARVPAGEQAARRVADVMTPRDEVPAIEADHELFEALESSRGMRPDSGRMLVMDRGRLVGLLAPSDVARAIELGEARRAGTPEEEGARRSPGLLVWAVVGLAFLAAAGFLYHPPLVVLEPAETRTVEDEIAIEGAAVSEIDGDYELTAVRIGRTHALGALVAWLRPDRQVLPFDDVVPEGTDPDRYAERQEELFDESRQLAAVAGARAAGLDVAVDGDGAEVVGLIPDSPAADVLETDDVIVAVDGNPVPTSAALRDAVRGHDAGTELTLTVRPAGQAGTRDVTVEIASLPEVSGGAALGVLVTTRDLTVDLPFEISFAESDIGGPSAGLAYALAITDLLDEENLAAGRRVAATGTINTEGDVGAVGATDLKAMAADDADADLFLVPEGDTSDARGHGVDVRAARSLDDARRLLATAG